MRGSWVVLSPDSPADEGMRTRSDAGNPEAIICEIAASGKPSITRESSYLQSFQAILK